MEITVRDNGQVKVIDLNGNLTIGRNEESLREAVKRLIDEGHTDVLLNLAEVPTIDSSGIGAIIKSFTSLQENGGKLKVLRPSRMARQLLTITGLMSVLESFEDEGQAVSSF
jgi:anti-sigma B factor antagonist